MNDDIRSYIRACIRQYPDINGVPNIYWTDDKITETAAADYVCRELCDRLMYQTDKSPQQIIDEFIDDLERSEMLICELDTNRQTVFSWTMCVKIAHELKYLYF